ncbi:hypothetical protein F4678DRAFT_462001 [Xylaria arbuscula]|nr:hypothetical protein F4678DRAFT_462001 [Xylaria arbuscula]
MVIGGCCRRGTAAVAGVALHDATADGLGGLRSGTARGARVQGLDDDVEEEDVKAAEESVGTQQGVPLQLNVRAPVGRIMQRLVCARVGVQMATLSAARRVVGAGLRATGDDGVRW